LFARKPGWMAGETAHACLLSDAVATPAKRTM
jgi:hypothetical protein